MAVPDNSQGGGGINLVFHAYEEESLTVSLKDHN
jgi:hypothetical protein